MSNSTPTSISSLSGTSSSQYSSTTVAKADILQSQDSLAVDLECDIQSQRITKILDNAVYKTKLAICLPILVEEQETLSRVLKPQDFKELFGFFKHTNDPLISSLINMEAVECIESGDTTLRHRLLPEMAYFLCMLNGYDLLKSKVEEIIEKIREDYNCYKHNFVHEGKPMPPGFPYLLELERLHDLTLTQTSKSAAEWLHADITTRKLEVSNRKFVERIQEVATILPEEKKHFEECMAGKNQQILLLQKELMRCSQVADAKRKQTVRRSNHQMMLLTAAHNVKSPMFKEIEDESHDFYNKILHGHVSEETTLRAKRRKVEGQLKAFIAKYDADMEEKQKELDEVEGLYDEEMKLCRKLERELTEQNKEFEPLILERDEEYHVEMTDKMNSFIVEHAARVIQCAWRQVGANRVEKQRLRKALKKMQAAKENAEMRAKADEEAMKKAAKNVKKKSKNATSEESEEKSD